MQRSLSNIRRKQSSWWTLPNWIGLKTINSKSASPELMKLPKLVAGWKALKNIVNTPTSDIQKISCEDLYIHWCQSSKSLCLAPSHYLDCLVANYHLNQCCPIVNWTLRDTLQWNFNQNTKYFIHEENASANIVCEMAAILSRGRWVKCITWPLVS